MNAPKRQFAAVVRRKHVGMADYLGDLADTPEEAMGGVREACEYGDSLIGVAIYRLAGMYDPSDDATCPKCGCREASGSVCPAPPCGLTLRAGGHR
jgi:hypothetical protein